MKQLSQSTAQLIAISLCRNRAELKKWAAYWAERTPDATNSAALIAETQELYRRQLDANALAVQEISEELVPGLRLHTHIFPEIADVFEEADPAATQQGAKE